MNGAVFIAEEFANLRVLPSAVQLGDEKACGCFVHPALGDHPLKIPLANFLEQQLTVPLDVLRVQNF